MVRKRSSLSRNAAADRTNSEMSRMLVQIPEISPLSS